MKIYARQVEPQYQRSPLFDCFPENIVVCGNNHFNEHTIDIFDRVVNTLKKWDLYYELENLEEKIKEVIEFHLSPERKKHYTNDEIKTLYDFILNYNTCPGAKENSILCSILSIVDGAKWDYRVINGSRQSDWNYVYYRTNEWTEKSIREFEIMYFNKGTEWEIHDDEEIPETPEDVHGYFDYCTSWNIEGIKKEISKITGEKPENIILYAFDGYTKIAKYKEI